MSEFSHSYVLRVLLATHTPTRTVDAVARRWRWLRASVCDPYRPELHYMRGPGPKWRAKHARGAGLYTRRARGSPNTPLGTNTPGNISNH
jgi:hypothetical protein